MIVYNKIQTKHITSHLKLKCDFICHQKANMRTRIAFPKLVSHELNYNIYHICNICNCQKSDTTQELHTGEIDAGVAIFQFILNVMQEFSFFLHVFTEWLNLKKLQLNYYFKMCTALIKT